MDDEDRWKPMVRRARTIPWGYKLDPQDPWLLLPDFRLLKLLDVARRAWAAQTSTQGDIAAWLSAKSGVPITRIGLRKRLLITERKIKRREQMRQARANRAANGVVVTSDAPHA